MKNKILSCLTVALATVSLFFTSCEDEVSGIGNSISSSEVTISVDSITYMLDANTVNAPAFESRSAYNLLGSIRIPEYGSLDCSYVTQFLPAETLNLPDTITANDIDSVRLVMTVPRAYITGDTLAPQQMKVFPLTKQLPGDIGAGFTPEGYYDPSNPLAVKNYTMSGYLFNDSTYSRQTNIRINTGLPVDIGRKMVDGYTSDPDIFVWPEKFAQYFPGIYVTPSFGQGCISPIYATEVYAYFPQTQVYSEKDEEGETVLKYKQVPDSVCLLTTAPEVISNVNISYSPSQYLKDMISDGKRVMTTPGGYTVALKFPTNEILEQYWREEYDMGVINNIVFTLPAKAINNNYGLGVPPALLMVKSSELDAFFAEGKLPDDKSSFTSLYSSENSSYTFTSMRDYIVDLKNKGKENITAEDIEFTLVPVSVVTEEYNDPNTYIPITVVTSIAPYIIKPTMMELDTDNARIVFTYSSQILY